jgi:ribulose bisphosphate carboxylase small subunit
MNIAFSKNGKSIKFLSKNFSPTGGDVDAGSMLQILANNNPDHTFYIIGRSEYNRLSEAERVEFFPYGNVVDSTENVSDKKSHTYLIENVDKAGIKIDAHVMMCGQMGSVSIPGRTKQIKNPDEVSMIIDMTLGYSSAINHWQNEHPEVPMIEICTDPRYTTEQTRDLIPSPKVCLSQYDDEYIRMHIRSFEDQERIPTAVQRFYSGIETMFLYGRDRKPVNVEERTENFLVVLNEGKPSRYKLLKHWVLDRFEDVSVFGEWDEPMTKEDKRFVGSLKFEELHKRLNSVRSSFIIPIAPGWVTAKYIELVYSGVVPFMHPTYDGQEHLRGKIPEQLYNFIKPATPKELYDRIEMMKDDKVYMKTITALQTALLTDDEFDGTKINSTVMKAIDMKYEKTTKQFEKHEVSSLNDFF